MLSKDLNERLTQTGADTAMGKLLRMYWHPIAAAAQMEKNPVRSVRVLGEDLTLFRGRDGEFGLVGQRCAHRRVDMKYGFPSYEHANALVCPYHGWTYDKTGQCIAQPAERSGEFKNLVKIPAYPVKAIGGLIFAYLGPQPAPECPAWESMVMDDTLRYIEYGLQECNWVQCQENSTDRTHAEWLHGHYARYSMERRGIGPEDPRYQVAMRFTTNPTDEFLIEPFEFGFIRRHTIKGGSKEEGTWAVGQPLIFPAMNITSSGTRFTMIWRTPVDDTSTMSWFLHGVYPGEGIKVPPQPVIEANEITHFDENGEINAHLVAVQDSVAFFAQGPIVDRTKERLGSGDRDVVQWRNSLIEQLEIVEKGGMPTVGILRDPERAKCVKLPLICKDDPLRFGIYQLTSEAKYQKRSSTSNYSSGASTQIVEKMEEYAQMGAEAWLKKNRGKTETAKA